MANTPTRQDKYERSRNQRDKYVDQVLKSSAKKRIVVAGPGTGKTYLFKKILADKKPCLTLTFVNSLVEDLSLDLCGISEVKTLHGFALGVIKKAIRNKEIKLFPKLANVISEDGEVLLNKTIDFDRLFHNRHDVD